MEHKIVNSRVYWGFAYFTETEIFLLKVLYLDKGKS